MTVAERILELQNQLAKSKSISDKWEAELKELDEEKDFYELRCTEQMIADAKMNQAYLEHEIQSLHQEEK